jgi:hypothetical protein
MRLEPGERIVDLELLPLVTDDEVVDDAAPEAASEE